MFLGLFASVVSAGNTESERATLRGLEGVDVVVEDIRNDAERDGLTKDAVQTDVELRLRQAGIRVLTREERLNTPGQPWLYVKVFTVTRSGGLCAYNSIDVEFWQSVRLDRDSSLFWGADQKKWSTPRIVGTAEGGNLRDVRETLRDKVDQFINAYLSVNPKE